MANSQQYNTEIYKKNLTLSNLELKEKVNKWLSKTITSYLQIAEQNLQMELNHPQLQYFAKKRLIEHDNICSRARGFIEIYKVFLSRLPEITKIIYYSYLNVNIKYIKIICSEVANYVRLREGKLYIYNLTELTDRKYAQVPIILPFYLD